MPPKKASTASAKKASGTTPAHASYQDMIKEAIVNLKERSGSSRQAIKKYIQANNNLGSTTDAQFSSHLSRALKAGVENNVFEQPKGASGPVKLKKAAPKSASEKPASKPAAKSTKTAAPKKAAAKKTAAPKKAATKAAPAKKAAAKPKANASKTRKTPASAPAVEDKPAVVLGKTKSGRVTKTKAPAAASKPKKAAPKKAAAKKAAPKKATPKKAAA